MIPPTAPMPTMTTSVFSVAIVLFLFRSRLFGLGLQSDHWHASERFLALHIGSRENGLRAGETDQAPAGEVFVSAVKRIGEHAFHGVRANCFEERLWCGPGKSGRLSFLERRDDRVLLWGAEADERFAICSATVLIELRQAVAIKILQIRVGTRERQINVVQHSGIACARLARCTGHEPLRESLNRRGIVTVEERAETLAVLICCGV